VITENDKNDKNDFDNKTKKELIRKFYEHTEQGGYLFIGHSESIAKDDAGYNYVNTAIYKKP